MAAVFFRFHANISRTSECSLREPIRSSQFRLLLLKQLFGRAHNTLHPFGKSNFFLSFPFRHLSAYTAALVDIHFANGISLTGFAAVSRGQRAQD
jgi:hypothetical protein